MGGSWSSELNSGTCRISFMLALIINVSKMTCEHSEQLMMPRHSGAVASLLRIRHTLRCISLPKPPQVSSLRLCDDSRVGCVYAYCLSSIAMVEWAGDAGSGLPSKELGPP